MILGKKVRLRAYREDDLAFLFVLKEKWLYVEILGILEHYHAKSICKYKSLHD